MILSKHSRGSGQPSSAHDVPEYVGAETPQAIPMVVPSKTISLHARPAGQGSTAVAQVSLNTKPGGEHDFVNETCRVLTNSGGMSVQTRLRGQEVESEVLQFTMLQMTVRRRPSSNASVQASVCSSQIGKSEEQENSFPKTGILSAVA